ncbi:MAG: phage tail tape measure protein, partial [Pseudomonadota bacterium]
MPRPGSNALDVTLRLLGNSTGLVDAVQDSSDVLQRFRGLLSGAAADSNTQGSAIFGGLARLAAGAIPQLRGVTLALQAAGAATAIISAQVAAEQEKRLTRLRAQLGATEEAAREYNDTAKEIFRGDFTDDIDEAVDALVDAQRRFKEASQDSLQGVTQDALRINEVFEKDTSESLRVIEALMRNFGITSKEATDFYVSGLQQGLDRAGDFGDTIIEYSTQLASAGANAGEFFSLLETGLDNGAFNTDKLADSYGEFRKRIQDGSKTTADALAQIGIEAEAFNEKLASGEVTANQAFTEIIDRLRNTDDSTKQMQASVGLLGTQFEDLGNTATLSIDTTKTSLEDLAGATESLNVISETSGARLNKTFRQLRGEVSDVITPIVGGLSNALKDVTNLGLQFPLGLIRGAKEAASLIGGGLAESFDIVKNKISSVINSGISALPDSVKNAFAAIQTGANTYVIPAFNAILNGASSILEALGNIPVAWELLNRSAQLAASYIDQAFNTVFNAARESLAFLLDKASQATFFIPGLAETSLELGNMASAFREAAKSEEDFAGIRKQIITDSQNRIAKIEDEQTATTETIRLNKEGIEVDEERIEQIKREREALEKRDKAKAESADLQKELNKLNKDLLKDVDKLTKQDKRRKDQLDSLVEKLKEERDTLGFTTAEMLKYRAAKLGAEPETLQLIESIQKEIDEHKRLEKEQEAAAKASERAAKRMKDAYVDAFDDATGALDDFLGNLLKGQLDFGNLAEGLLSSGLKTLSSGGSSGDLLGGLVGSLKGGGFGDTFDLLTGGGFLGGSNAADFVGPPAPGQLDLAVDFFGSDSPIVGALDSVSDTLDGVFGAGNGLGAGLGIAGAGLSLLSGDKQGAVGGLGSVLGSLTPLGPLGGFIGGQLGSLVGDQLFGTWETEAEGVSREIKGLEASFSHAKLEVNDGLIGGGRRITKTLIEADDELQAGFNGILSNIDNIGTAIGQQSFSQNVSNFRGFQSGLLGATGVVEHEGVGSLEEAQGLLSNRESVRLLQESFRGLRIAVEDETKSLGQLLDRDIRDIFHRVNEGVFNEALGDLSVQLERHVNFEPGTAAAVESIFDALENIDVENVDPAQLNDQISGLISTAFQKIDAPIPQDGINDIATAVVNEITEAVAFQTGNIDAASLITEDGGFFAELRKEVQRFSVDTPVEDIGAFIENMLTLKDVFKAAGLDTDDLEQKVIRTFGGFEQASAKLTGFTQKFVSDESKRAKAVDVAQKEITDLFNEIQRRGLEVPTTRDALADLFQELELTAPGVREFADSILTSQDSLDLFFTTNESFIQATTTQADKLAQAQATVEDVFNRLGLEIPETASDFNDLVLSLDKTSESGLAAFFELSRISGEFQEIANNAGEASNALADQQAAQAKAREEEARALQSMRSLLPKFNDPEFTDLNAAFTQTFGHAIGLTEQLSGKYENFSGQQFENLEQLQAFAFAAARANEQELTKFGQALGPTDLTTIEDLRKDILAYVLAEKQRLSQIKEGTDTTKSAAEAAKEAEASARGLMQAFTLTHGIIDGLRDRVGDDISAIEQALGRAPSAADNLAAIEDQIANLFVDDNTSIEQSISLREQQRQAVLDVMQEELDAIEERRQAEQASHQDALKLYEEQQKAIDNVIN